MGLFDGAIGRADVASTDFASTDFASSDFASTAHVARLLAAPIVLVVSAAGAGRSIAATVHGFASFDPRVQVAGVVLNRVSTPRHEQILREALTDLGVPVLGALPAQAELHAPSRHLGLVPAAERAAQVRDWLPRLRELVSRHLDLDRLLAIARSRPRPDRTALVPRTTPSPWRNPPLGRDQPPPESVLPAQPVPPARPVPPGLPAPAGRLVPAESLAPYAAHRPRLPLGPIRIAVAAGRAFTFGYAEHRELLEAAGAEVVEFDPMADEHLPAGCDALIAGGGFPEVYAAELSANASLRAEVRQRAAAGMPVVAECAGLLWLGADLDGQPQCGVLPASARMTGKLTLGYREAVAVTSSPLAAAGTTIRAHEFHRTVSEPANGAASAWRLTDGRASRAGPPTACWPPTCTCTGPACPPRPRACSPPPWPPAMQRPGAQVPPPATPRLRAHVPPPATPRLRAHVPPPRHPVSGPRAAGRDTPSPGPRTAACDATRSRPLARTQPATAPPTPNASTRRPPRRLKPLPRVPPLTPAPCPPRRPRSPRCRTSWVGLW